MGKYEAKISEIKDKIVKEIKPEKIILFGSYAWGNPNEDSDVDLFIIQKTSEPKRARQTSLRKKLFSIGVPMDIIIYTPEELEKRMDIRDVFVRKILRDGKVLHSV
jgi:predicted nucleotidyltransferase